MIRPRPFLIVTILLLFSQSLLAKRELARSVARVKTTYSFFNPRKPYQATPPKNRSGQVFAVAPNQLIGLASEVKHAKLVQIQPGFQTQLIQAKVVHVDYALDLCLLEVDLDDLEKPFIPLKFHLDIKLKDKIELAWLTSDRRVIKTSGTVEHPIVLNDQNTGAAIMSFEVSSKSSPGGYSEPALKNNKIIGIISSFDSSDNSSVMLPSTLIYNFFKNTRKKDTYKNIPKIGFRAAPLKDNITRSYFNIPDNESRGILITNVFDFGTGSTQFKENDILLKWGDFDINPEGLIFDSKYGYIKFWYMIGHSNLGNKVEVLILRDGILKKQEIELKSFKTEHLPIPFLNDTRPEFIIEGGFVLQELTYDYLKSFGKNWKAYIDPYIISLFEKNRFKKFEDINRPVILTHVLKHSINQGYQHLNNLIIKELNGVEVKGIQHLSKLISKLKKESSYLEFEFDQVHPKLVIPTISLNQANKQIQNNYQIPTTSYVSDK